jgi:hypothetical protein
MRFNHMELTLPRGTLTSEFREEIDAFCHSVFGWLALDTEVDGQIGHLLIPGPDQFILLAERDSSRGSPVYDHIGLLQDSREEVDRLLSACERYAEMDDRVTIVRCADLVSPDGTVHAFDVRYLLPVYFDVESMERVAAA